jgi:hypothetical protein
MQKQTQAAATAGRSQRTQQVEAFFLDKAGRLCLLLLTMRILRVWFLPCMHWLQFQIWMEARTVMDLLVLLFSVHRQRLAQYQPFVALHLWLLQQEVRQKRQLLNSPAAASLLLRLAQQLQGLYQESSRVGLTTAESCQ